MTDNAARLLRFARNDSAKCHTCETCPCESREQVSSSDVRFNLYQRDAQYVSILPDEYIDLEFTADGGPDSGLVRGNFS